VCISEDILLRICKQGKKLKKKFVPPQLKKIKSFATNNFFFFLSQEIFLCCGLRRVKNILKKIYNNIKEREKVTKGRENFI